MILDSRNSEALTRIIAEKGWENVASISFSKATLTGLVELARLTKLGGPEALEPAKNCLRNLPGAVNWFNNIRGLFDGNFAPTNSSGKIYSAPKAEVWLITSSTCIETDSFLLFLQRFERSLRNSGFKNRFPKLISQGLLEIADNIARHSSVSGLPINGVLGYHVEQEKMNYVAADLGRGVLASLQENSKWASLQDESEALIAAARDGATRIKAHDSGDGFRQIFQSFVDREGTLLMRSGRGLAEIRGNATSKIAETGYSKALEGLRVTAACDLRKKSEEILLCC